METETITKTTPDAADIAAAGRPYPVRDALAPVTPHSARAHLLELRAWWLDAAEGFLRYAQAGTKDAVWDAKLALAAADHYAPKARS